MNCLECSSAHLRKKEIQKGKDNHIYCNCCRQFIQDYELAKTYSNDAVKMARAAASTATAGTTTLNNKIVNLKKIEKMDY